MEAQMNKNILQHVWFHHHDVESISDSGGLVFGDGRSLLLLFRV